MLKQANPLFPGAKTADNLKGKICPDKKGVRA